MSTTSPAPPIDFPRAELPRLLAGLMLALLMAALDQTIVAVALPRIGADLKGFEWLAWVASGYLVAAAVATPIYGKLGDLYGRRTMLLWAIWIFLAASVACALATSMPMLVAARILQGLGGGGLFAVTQAAVADVVTPRERGRYQGYFSITYATASVAGPVLGGLLTEYLSWQYIFWINLPLGAAALFITRDSLKRLPVPHIRRQVDYLGAILLCGGLASGMIGFTRVGQGAAWLSSVNLALFSAALVLLFLFVLQQLRSAEPIVPLGLFRIPVIAMCMLILFFSFSQLIVVSILVPLRSQMVGGWAADASALQLVPLSLGSPMGAFLGGMLISRTGRYKPGMALGATLLPLALLAVAFSNPANLVLSSLALLVTGFSIGIQLPTSLVAVQHAAPRPHIGIATAATTFARQLGASVCVAVVTAVLMGALSHSAAGTELASTGAEMMGELIGSRIADLPSGERAQLALLAAGAFREALLACAALTIVSLLLVWRLPNHLLHEREAPTAGKSGGD